MPALILSGVAGLLHLAVFVLLAPALLATYALARTAAAGQTVPRGSALVTAALTVWRGSSFRIDGVSGIATAAPLLSAASALAAMAIVPGFCHGPPSAGLADPIIVATLLLVAELAPVLAALAVATSALGQAATHAAAELLRRFVGLVLVAFATLAVGGSLDAGVSDATPVTRAILLAAALVAVVQAAEALEGAPGLLAELGGPDRVLQHFAAAARAAVLLTFARDLVLPWLWPDSLPDAAALPRWPLAMAFWVATLLLAAALLGVLAGRVAPARPDERRRRSVALAAVAAGALLTALLGQAAP